MRARTILMALAASACLGGTVSAQPAWVPPGNDPDGYYSDADHDGYYDRQGHYHRIHYDRGGYYDPYGAAPPPPPPPPPGPYYREGDYERACQRGNQTAGTIFGALAGGLLGGGVSHGNGGAVIGGAVLGGLLGNAIASDIDCEDQPYAFRVYADGLNGDVGRRYEWRHGRAYGYFTPTREFRRGGLVCRDFTETTYRGGQSFTRSGTACRQTDGNWRFD